MTLDEAWQQAEDARPDSDMSIDLLGPVGTVHAHYVAWCWDGKGLPFYASADGDTPVEALRSLSAKLRAMTNGMLTLDIPTK